MADDKTSAADEMREAIAENRRLQEQHRGDRRQREQHAAMLQSVRGLKSQVEAELAVRKQLEAELAELKAKVQSCVMNSHMWINRRGHCTRCLLMQGSAASSC